MTAPIRILLVDDHPVVRSGIRAMLAGQPDFELVGEAATGEDGVEAARALAPDVVLMDLQFGTGIHGSEATRRIVALGGPRVLVLTTFDTDADIVAAVEAGATGYLLKDAPSDDLHAAIRSSATGTSALAPSVASRLLGRVRTPATTLSPRELEVLGHVAAGLSNRQIGKQMFLSETTVKTHLVHIYAKLGVDSRTSAVAAATRKGLIRPA
ncbi:response regulator transcription factor [Streptosporangium sp. NBC_01755]|uniref:response regulator transcription factor n=1 Tax=unclassified Streptosporangium TaxID=2632669 RepID=UPI002DDB121F|nr:MULTISPECIES: response regulator transcription factor [unclassified Streptosporangium]WSA28658.1 response regulator transcription factor [Streptosporangium sp. NBC_01810]WSC99890.1 response regulator transcription factor [Streptosporangium sp. NBC_01755]WSD03185.1 response regulator transcription factor [Streptosporangium sp. NBC_01755]